MSRRPSAGPSCIGTPPARTRSTASSPRIRSRWYRSRWRCRLSECSTHRTPLAN